MAAEKTYSLKDVDDWQSKLKDFARTPRTRFSKKQVIEALIEEIEEALEAHPYEQVAERLKDWGLDIAAGSLRQYVSAYRREHSNETTETTQKRTHSKNKKATPRRSPSNKKAADEESNHNESKREQTVDSAKPESVVEKSRRSPTDNATSTSKKPGRGRLQSDEDSSRYPGNQGQPIEVKTEL